MGSEMCIRDRNKIAQISLRCQKYRKNLFANVETKDMLVRPKMKVRRSLRRGAEPLEDRPNLKVRRSLWRRAEPLDHTPKKEW